MSEQRGFAEWEGTPVVVLLAGTPASARPGSQLRWGTLEEVNNMGLVLRHSIEVRWPTGAYDEIGGQLREGETREVSQFFPWHSTVSVRPLEPEERQEHGL